MRRFFIDKDSAVNEGDIVILPESESRHISKVLRLKSGDRVELLDGKGAILGAELVELGRSVTARILSRTELARDGIELVVGQGMLKGKKMDTVVQKCTELGVSRFIPFSSSRCQGKLRDHEDEKKIGRFTRIVEASCKQCLRPDPMVVEQPSGFAEMIRGWKGEQDETVLKILFWEEEKSRTLHDIRFEQEVKKVTLLLGPEGGLTREEVREAENLGFCTVSLGSRILRAETATLTAVSVIQFMAGNI